MALNIDHKVYRNLQEQVSWLTTTVDEIIDVTDLEALQQVVDSIEGYKHDIDLEVGAMQNTLDGFQNTMNGYATTMNGYANTMGGYATTMNGYANTMNGWSAQVNTWANNISAAAVSAISGQAITPLTVKQSQANYSGTLSVVGYNTGANLTATSLYQKYEEINGLFYIVILAKFTNETASDITISYLWGSLNAQELPNDIASKIYDMEGQAINLVGHNNVMIATSHAYIRTDTDGQHGKYDGYLNLTKSNNARNIRGWIYTGTNLTIHPGDSIYFETRLIMTLI